MTKSERKSSSSFHLPAEFTETILRLQDNCQSFHPDVNTDLDADDDIEIFLIKAPVELAPSELNGKIIKKRKRTKLTSKKNQEEYEMTLDKDAAGQFSSNVVMLPDSDSGKLKASLKPIKGLISITSSVSVPTIVYEDDVPQHPTFPEGLKIRYTPFGSDKPVAVKPLSKKRKFDCKEEKADKNIRVRSSKHSPSKIKSETDSLAGLEESTSDQDIFSDKSNVSQSFTKENKKTKKEKKKQKNQ